MLPKPVAQAEIIDSQTPRFLISEQICGASRYDMALSTICEPAWRDFLPSSKKACHALRIITFPPPPEATTTPVISDWVSSFVQPAISIESSAPFMAQTQPRSAVERLM